MPIKMFKTFLTLIILFSYASIQGQDWLPIGTKWSYKSSFFGESAFNNEYLITGDTILGGKSCRILEKSQESCDLKPQVEYFYKEEGKLYYYSNDLDFKLLYDFSAEVGETITIPIWEGFGTTNDRYIRIDSIVNISLEGLELKKFYVSDGYLNTDGSITYGTSGIPNNNIIIEDIGRLGTFSHYLESAVCDASYTFPLDSFYHPNYGFLDFNETTLNSEEFQEFDISIHPNPSNDLIQIKNASSTERVVIINQIGQIFYEMYYSNSKENLLIDISKFNSGVYYVQVFGSQSKLLKICKIVVI